MMSIHTVGYESDELQDKAKALAEQLHFNVDQEADHCLFVTTDQVALKLPNYSLMSADFSVATWKKRQAEGKKQGLVRACKPQVGMKIIDATAGWGKDAAILASFGAEVVMIERHPIVNVLLASALENRAELDKHQLQLSLINDDAISYLKTLASDAFPDVIYIDPMHPERSKTALVKKEMQVLQQMIGADQDVLDLILCARQRVKQRVVVKWPQKVPGVLVADGTIAGKTVRFDLYFPQK